MACFLEFSEPGAYLVDFISFCRPISCSWYWLEYSPTFSVKYIPEWFPGAGFQKKASETKKILRDFANIPFQFTLDQTVFWNFWWLWSIKTDSRLRTLRQLGQHHLLLLRIISRISQRLSVERTWSGLLLLCLVVRDSIVSGQLPLINPSIGT